MQLEKKGHILLGVLRAQADQAINSKVCSVFPSSFVCRFPDKERGRSTCNTVLIRKKKSNHAVISSEKKLV